MGRSISDELGTHRALLLGERILCREPSTLQPSVRSRTCCARSLRLLERWGILDACAWTHARAADCASAALDMTAIDPSVVHPAHAATWHRWMRGFLLWPLGHHRFRCDQKPSDRRRVLQGTSHDLGGVDHTLAGEIAIFTRLCIVPEVVGCLVEDLSHHHGAVFAGINRDEASRPGQGLAHDVDSRLLVVVLAFEVLEGLGSPEQGHPTARNDPLLHRRTGGVESVLDAVFPLFHLHFCGAANLNDGNTTRQLRQSLLQLLLVIV